MIKKLTNATDLRECLAQIKLLKQLLTQPETFDLDKVLEKLEIKKKLLMKYRMSDYATISEGLESGTLVLEEKVEIPEEKEFEYDKGPKIDEKAIALEKAREAKAEKALLEAEKAKKEAEAKAKKEADAKAKKEAEEKALLEKELQIAKDKLTAFETAKELGSE